MGDGGESSSDGGGEGYESKGGIAFRLGGRIVLGADAVGEVIVRCGCG